MKNYYEIMELTHTATQEEIKQQYLYLVQIWHPDKVQTPAMKAKAEERLKEINEAWETLKNPSKRAQYDSKKSSSGFDNKNPREKQDKADAEPQQQRQQGDDERWGADNTQNQNDNTKTQGKTNKYKKTGKKEIGFAIFCVVGLVLGMILIRVSSPQTPVPTIVMKSVPTIEHHTVVVHNPKAVFEEKTALNQKAAEKLPEATKPTAEVQVNIRVISKDRMVEIYIPEGKFWMGSENGRDDEKPRHQVMVAGYWIDKYEVTNLQYARCVEDGGCDVQYDENSSKQESYYGNTDFDDYPVIWVDWNMAKVYCAWAGRRLPTEAEWEKAAKGTDGRKYPWGNAYPDRMRCNYKSNIGDTSVVGSYPQGASPYGVMDMAGNVWEWTSSLYMSYPYVDTDGREDLNANGDRVIRGASWYFDAWSIRSALRWGDNPVTGLNDFGFRCASSQ